MAVAIACSISAPALASGGAGGGAAVLTREQAQARGANTVSRSQCIATCQTRSPQPQTCPNSCVPPNCYAARTGGAYCVK